MNNPEQYDSYNILPKLATIRKDLAVEEGSSLLEIDALVDAICAMDYDGVRRFLSQAFYWFETEDGFDFWSDYQEVLDDMS